MKSLQKIFFRLREPALTHVVFLIRRIYWCIQGMEIGDSVILPKIFVTWPHQVLIGDNCKLEQNIFFKYDGVWRPGPSILVGAGSFIGANVEFNIRKKIAIGQNCLIASGCKFIDHDHGFASRNLPINLQTDGNENEIVLEEDVWLGCNVVVLKGVKIGRGAIVAAGSVVSKCIPSHEIWAGIPARKLSDRPA